jgi:hypothetical protein
MRDRCSMINKRAISFIIIFLFIKVALLSQSIDQAAVRGTLVDERNNPVPYATVLLKNSHDSSLYKSAQSNEHGIFTFPSVTNGTYFLEASVIGFKKSIVTNIKVSDANKRIDIGNMVLQSSVKTLETVIIKADVPLIERQIDKTVVNVAQSITSEGLTALEVMQKLPGVQVTQDGQITMSGKSGVNVYIDGKPTYLSATDLASLLSGMPASEIQKIEIMSNPSSKYDASGTSGIINIVKRKNKKEGLNGSLNTSFSQGYYGKYNEGFTLNYKTDKYNLLLNNAYVYNKSFSNRSVISDISNEKNNLQTEQVSNNDGINSGRNYRPTMGLDLYLSKKTILTLSGTAGFGSSNNALISAMDINDSTRIRINHIDFNSQLKDNPFNYTASVQLTHQLDTNGRMFTVGLDHSDYRNYPLQNNLSTLGNANNVFVSETDALLLQHRQLDIYAVKADYVRPLKTKGSLEVGIKSSYVKANNDNTYYNQSGGQNIIDLPRSDYSINSENINAVYINFNKTYNKITVQVGFRVEQTVTKGRQILTGQSVDQNYLQLFPTLFFDDKLTDESSITIRLGRRIERAAYSEMVPFRRPQTPTLYFEGNPNLKPDISYHAEIEWSYQSAFFITFGYDIDKDYLRTFPYLDSNKVTITRRPTNVQGARSWNIDLIYSKKMVNWWSTDNSVSIYRNSFSGNADGFSLDNSGIASIELSTNNSFPINSKLAFEADFEYDSKRQFVNSTFGAYSILSFGVKHSLFNNKGSVSLNAHNVLQSENHNAIDRNSGLYQYSYLNFYTRAFTLTFVYRFGSGKVAKTIIKPGSEEEQKRAGN